MTEKLSCEAVVIGAGVIGLACASALARSGREVLLLEAEDRFGSQTSSRNSEVVHSGIYYPTGSLKHRLCVRGRRLLYAFMDEWSVPYRKLGKLIVATNPDEEVALGDLYRRALANDVEGILPLSRQEAMKLEPNLNCTAALLSAETGVMDSHALMMAMLGDAERHGAQIVYRTSVQQILSRDSGGFAILVKGDHDSLLEADIVVNAAGLCATELAAHTDGLDPSYVPALHLAKGSYFTCPGKAFTRLVYPLPVKGGLGVHLTLDLAGRMRFGPDVEWLDHASPNAVEYAVDTNRSTKFYEAVRRYWPGLPDDVLRPDYSGCRPKLGGAEEGTVDFRIDGPAVHGLRGLVNLFGIESPGLTASLAIAELTSDMLNI